MRLGRRLLASALVGFAGLGLANTGGCGMIAGVDFDKARPGDLDGGNTAPRALPDGAIDPTAPGGGEGRISGPATSSCTPEPNAITCADKCGAATDNCNAPRSCAASCGSGKACTNGKCECLADGNWCNNRCGATNDNCGRPVDCGACAGGAPCTDNACGCAPQPVATACGSKACGTAVNNCGQVVACGNSGQCATAGAVCMPDGSCCVDNGAACAGRCGGEVVTNNCGQQVGCPQACPSGQVCVGTSCCTPQTPSCAGVACGPAPLNNCGQSTGIICPNTCSSLSGCGVGGAGPNACCVPNDPCDRRCSGTAVNSCGVTVTCNNTCSVAGDICPCRGGTCQASGYCSCHTGPCL